MRPSHNSPSADRDDFTGIETGRASTPSMARPPPPAAPAADLPVDLLNPDAAKD